VKFWETSAVVPLCITEPRSAKVKATLIEDPDMVVWWATRTECVSACMRQVRERSLQAGGERQARQVLQTLAKAWTEIQPNEVLRGTAERSLAVHSLTAADAYQLAAALQWCQSQTQNMFFVTFDDRLRSAAHKEGFSVLPIE
jgi:uncharacterized protein